MKKFFVILIALLTLPFSTTRSEWTWHQTIFGAVTGGLVIARGYYWYTTAKNVSANNESIQSTNTQLDKKNPQDPANDSHKKDSDNEPKKDNDTALFHSIIKDSAHTAQRLLEESNKKPSSTPSPILEKLVHQPDKSISKQPITSKPTETITQKDPSFLERWLDYSADYKELHDNHRDIFEG